MKQYLKKFCVVLFGAFIICIPVFYNGYPLLCYDSGTYIRSGFLGSVSIDRPLGYGLFVRHSSMAFSLWFTVYAQCVILSGVLFILLRNFIKSDKFNFLFIGLLTILTFFTNVGWCAGQIMADIFTSIFILSFINILLTKKMDIMHIIFLAFIFIIGCTTHFTNLLIAITSSIILLLCIILFKTKIQEFNFYFKRVLLVCSFTIVSFFACLLINYTHPEGGGFRLSKGSHVFLMAHFVQAGTMEEFLKENCNKPEFKDCKICLCKDSLETSLDEFLWTWDGTLQKTGGWQGSEQEYNFVIKKMFSDINFIVKNIYLSVRFGITQLFSCKVGDGIVVLDKNTPPAIEINKYFHDELNSFLHSKQNSEPYLDKNLETINNYDTILLVFSAFGILYYLFYYKSRNKEFFLGILIVFFLCLNAFFTAGLNAPCPRFQSRVAWLIPLFFFIIIYNHRTYIFKIYKTVILNFNNNQQ